MKKSIGLLVLLVAVASLSTSPRAANDTIAIIGATLIDGSGGAPVADAVVVLER